MSWSFGSSPSRNELKRENRVPMVHQAESSPRHHSRHTSTGESFAYHSPPSFSPRYTSTGSYATTGAQENRSSRLGKGGTRSPTAHVIDPYIVEPPSPPGHSRNVSLGPESAAFPQRQTQVEWSMKPAQFTGRRRTPSEYSNVPASSANHAPNLSRYDAFDSIEHQSPIQNPQDSSLYQEAIGIGSFDLSDPQIQHAASPEPKRRSATKSLPGNLHRGSRLNTTVENSSAESEYNSDLPTQPQQPSHGPPSPRPRAGAVAESREPTQYIVDHGRASPVSRHRSEPHELNDEFHPRVRSRPISFLTSRRPLIVRRTPSSESQLQTPRSTDEYRSDKNVRVNSTRSGYESRREVYEGNKSPPDTPEPVIRTVRPKMPPRDANYPSTREPSNSYFGEVKYSPAYTADDVIYSPHPADVYRRGGEPRDYYGRSPSTTPPPLTSRTDHDPHGADREPRAIVSYGGRERVYIDDRYPRSPSPEYERYEERSRTHYTGRELEAEGYVERDAPFYRQRSPSQEREEREIAMEERMVKREERMRAQEREIASRPAVPLAPNFVNRRSIPAPQRFNADVQRLNTDSIRTDHSQNPLGSHIYICSTISQDNTLGEHARKSKLLAGLGQILQRPAFSSFVDKKPEAAENAKDKKCRNMLIYGHCRYEGQGCAFNHDPY